MAPVRIIPAFYPLEYGIRKVFAAFPCPGVEQFQLHGVPERFHHGIIVTRRVTGQFYSSRDELAAEVAVITRAEDYPPIAERLFATSPAPLVKACVARLRADDGEGASCSRPNHKPAPVAPGPPPG
jgi:hypothetical protein